MLKKVFVHRYTIQGTENRNKSRVANRFLHYSLTVFFALLLQLAPFHSTSQQQALFADSLASRLNVDSSARLFISEIKITGNKKTKRYIIEREMRLKIGDSIPASEIYDRLAKSRDLIYNTALFTIVKIEPVFVSATNISLAVSVSEKWYIYPTPQFQLVDRNFNEWINTHNASLERVVYGVKFAHYNLSGRRDQLRVYLLNGFSRNISFNYAAPYSNRALTEGFSVGAGFTQNREVIYKTGQDNLPLRYTNNSFARSHFVANGSYIKRRGFYLRRSINVSFNHYSVDDSISTKYNPAYFNSPKSKVSFPEVSYTYQYVNTNNINYPLKGKVYTFLVTKRGIGINGGINMLSADIDYNRYIPHKNDWYSSLQAHAKVKTPTSLAYINQRALGYQDYYLRGLENYVIDGIHSALAAYTLRKKIISFSIPVPIKNKIVSAIPFTIYAKTFADAGYSYTTSANDTRLNNRFLYSGGFGLDVLSLYDMNLRMEYSFNQLGEKGLFLHVKGGF